MSDAINDELDSNLGNIANYASDDVFFDDDEDEDDDDDKDYDQLKEEL